VTGSFYFHRRIILSTQDIFNAVVAFDEAAAAAKTREKLDAGTVKGDLHDIGKNLVAHN
jgi:methanogenic corrinoid protein MtbC1